MNLPPGFVLESQSQGVSLPPGFVLEGAPKPPEEQSFLRQVADVPLGIARGAVQGVRMIADAFGAGSEASNNIKGVEEYLGGLLSAQAKNDQQEIARIMKEAEDKGFLDQVKAGVKAFTVAPIDTLSSALGTAGPVIIGALGSKLLGASALVGTGVSVLTGAGMGAGTIKGTIYEETKKALKEAGASEEDAEKKAQEAQSYGGKNLDQILLGTVIGGVAARGPLEKGAANMLARKILGKTAEEPAEVAAKEAAKGTLRRRVEAGIAEALPEAGQAAQEQVAENIALQREGFDVPTFRGAVSAGTLEGLAGAGLGATIGGGRPEVPAPAPEAPPAPPPAALEYKPEPYIQFPDGTVAKQSEVEAYIKTLPEDQQMAMRAKLRGLAPQEAEKEPAIPPVAEAPKPPVAEAPPTILSTPALEAQPNAASEVQSATPSQLDIRYERNGPVGSYIEGKTKIGAGSESDVYFDGNSVIKVLEPYSDKSDSTFQKRIDDALQVDKILGDGSLQYVGFYLSPNGTKNPVFRQPFVEGRPASRQEISDYMKSRGFEIDSQGKTTDTFSKVYNGQRFIAKDLDGDNVKVDASGNIRVIDGQLDVKPTEPQVETPAVAQTELPQNLQEFQERMPIIFDSAEVRAANNEGNFAKLTKALQRSSNPAIRRIGQLGGGIVSKITLKKPGRLGKNTAGRYTYDDDAIQMIPSYAGDEHTNAHEVLHALISKAQVNPTERQKPIVQKIDKLYEHVKRELKKKGITVRDAYGLKNAREFAAEAMTNPKFQYELMQIPYPGKKTAWTQFVQLVSDLLGIQNTNALTEVMNLVDRLAQTKQPRKTVTDKGLVDESVIETEPALPKTVAPAKAAPSGNPGQQALQTLSEMGMEVPKPEPGRMERTVEAIKKAKEDPKLTATSAASAFQRFADTIETWSFSSDAKLNNDYRRAVIKDLKSNEQIMGRLLEMSQSQAVHADALASQFLIDGGLKYNNDLKKWESFESKSNFAALSKKLDDIGKKYNLSKEQIERVAHAYLVAKRLPGIIKRNEDIEAEIAAEEATAKPDRKKINDLKDKIVFVSDKQMAQIEPGLSLVKTIPELKQVVDMWNDIRKNTIDVMVNSELWSPEYAEMMWDNIDYVPYYREDQIENEAGPQDFIKGLQVKSKEFQLKGSEDAVNDVFDNMIRWTQYAINRSVRNSKAVQMIDNALEIQVGDKPMARKVTEQKRGMNIVRVFRDGKQELYDMADPMYMSAFAGIQNVSIPTLKFMSKVSDVLRNSVVLYPLFSVAQVPQDACAAMFTSGLKTQHALKIPVLAVKEFIKTLMKTSQTHNTLKKFGATGVRDFSATVIRDDAEIYAGLKPPRGGWGKTKEFLQHISMAADNAVRQAVYEASMQQKLTQAEAIEKAFEIINFRRKGTSRALNIMGQTVPFFYAYLSAQRVALKVLTGVGISPSDRKDALTTLATTSAAVATLSMLYAMANGDDEDYAETPAAIRDRTLTIPGSGGVRIPLRSDFFLFPKIIAEHTYLLLADKGFEDPAKFKKSMADALINAVASPLPFPTAIKPAIEVAINYDFFQGKPLIGNFEKEKDVERQFRDSTSELAKLLGSTGVMSPIAIDHMIRGMFGSFGGLLLFGTNQFLHSDPDVPRPEMSAKEMLAALPGTSGLLKRPQESALKNDFYELRDEVEKAVNTFNDIKNRSPDGLEEFLENEKKMARYMLGKPVDQINRKLSKIRRVMTQITNMPEDQMSAADKAENLRELRETEREILRSVNVKELRKEAKL